MRVRSLLLAVALATASLTVLAVPGQAGEATCDQPLDVSLVLDRSGSMSGEPIETARQGASELVTRLTGNDLSGLVSYASFPRLDQSLTFDHDATAQAIENLTAGGATATGDAIDLSHDDIQDNARAGVDDTMILLTDGITNTGTDPVQQAEEAKADGIEIFAIGLGDSVNEADLREIASDPTERHFYQPQTTQELLVVFERIAEELDLPAAGEAHALDARLGASTGDRVLVGPIAQATSPPDEETRVAERTVSVDDFTVQVGAGEDESRTDVAPDAVGATSEARVSSLTIDDGTQTILEADVLQARASSEATPSGATASDEGTRLAGVEVLGEPLEAGVPPNTEIPVDEDTRLILNEQIAADDARFASLRVNLVHLVHETSEREVSLVVGSAYAAADCQSGGELERPAETETPPVAYEGPDEETSQGPATVNRGGCARNTMAVSLSGCSEGTVAASVFGPAQTDTGVAASGTGDSRAGIGAAVSGTGQASSTIGAAVSGTDRSETQAGASVSGTDDAYAPLGAAVSGTGDATGLAALSGTGNTTGVVLFSVTGECNERDCYEVRPLDDASAWTLAVAGDGESRSWVGGSVAGTGPATTVIGGAVSGTDRAETTVGAAASGTGDAYANLGAAVSATGEANVGTGAAVSGCNGVQVYLLVLSESQPSPVPVCQSP